MEHVIKSLMVTDKNIKYVVRADDDILYFSDARWQQAVKEGKCSVARNIEVFDLENCTIQYVKKYGHLVWEKELESLWTAIILFGREGQISWKIVNKNNGPVVAIEETDTGNMVVHAGNFRWLFLEPGRKPSYVCSLAAAAREVIPDCSHFTTERFTNEVVVTKKIKECIAYLNDNTDKHWYYYKRYILSDGICYGIHITIPRITYCVVYINTDTGDPVLIKEYKKLKNAVKCLAQGVNDMNLKDEGHTYV